MRISSSSITPVLAVSLVAWVAGSLQASRHSEHAGITAGLQTTSATRSVTPAPDQAGSVRAVLDQYCVGCHNERVKTAGLMLDKLDLERVGEDVAAWERVVKKLRAGAMPPPGAPRPDEPAYEAFVASLEDILDRAGDAAPNPGRPPIHRLNRSEYTNAIRDLFGLTIDGRAMLPADDTGYGFDNIADVLTLSPALLDRYLLAATKITRLVVGDSDIRPAVSEYNLAGPALRQDDRMSEDLPFGSRGGVAIRHFFPLDGDYTVKITLERSAVNGGYIVRGMKAVNEIDVRLDRERLKLFPLGGPDTEVPVGYSATEYAPDKGLEVRFRATAGSHTIAVSFNRDNWEMEGTGPSRLPVTSGGFFQARDTTLTAGRIQMGVQKVEIAGPFDGAVPIESDVRRRLFICYPSNEAEEEPCARRILSRIARLAYRRPVTDDDVRTLMGVYNVGRADGSFDAGIGTALRSVLVDPHFLFRLERDPAGAKPGEAYRISDLDLASRLSFFLWSSIPDEELLTVATEGKLNERAVLEQQVRRMLGDERASAFVNNFFGQWLSYRNVTAVRPDPKTFVAFDENLREAFQEETELFLRSQVREDRSALELLTANYTFVNERLARHYGIPGVVGAHFRRVTYPDDVRAGLLGHGSILTVTSYADRTSVVVRGKWIMDHLLGTPPPPPPPNVPALDATQAKGSLRQRMEIHRKNPVCATCHRSLDPLGFALENFDGIGGFRTTDAAVPIDASGVFVDGTAFNGPADFRQALLARQEAFLGTLVEKLLTYAVGRGMEPQDMPAVRRVVQEAESADYRWSALIMAAVRSLPFQMRSAAS